MQKVKSWFRTIDWDYVFSYNTTKNVRIRDRRLGILHWCFLLVALGIIIGEVFYNEQAYNDFDDIEGSVKLELSSPAGGIDTTKLTYCSSSCRNFTLGEPGCNCVYWDAADLLYPETEESAAFITTRATLTNNQRPQPPCSGSVCTSPWTNGTSVGPFYTVAPDQFMLSLDHEMIAPQFYQQDSRSNGGKAEGNSKWTRTSQGLWGQLLDTRGHVLYESPTDGDDVFSLGLLLQAAGVSIDALRDDGGIVRVNVNYGDCRRLIATTLTSALPSRCHALPLGEINYYQYQAQYLPSTTFGVTRTSYESDSDGTSVRDLKNLVGVRLLFRVGGQAGSFSFAAFLQSIMTIFLLFSVASFVVDFLVLYVVPGKQMYRNAKFEISENFHQLRKRLAMEKDTNNRILTVTKMARLQSASHVEKLLTNMKSSLTDNEYELLLLKCIEVYGQEKLDLKSAEAFFDRLESDQSRLKAHVLLGRLKEAYILAAKMDSVADIQTIRAQAGGMNNIRIQQLCDQYLAQRDARPRDAPPPATSPPLNSVAIGGPSQNPLYSEIELRAL
eukprot:TRINITY_DN9905_c1_g4_i1.p1 TRINITY_DN9905_c1_g4~~TRINITY_DN9905_c1_g4_i1.p1  ORF type:complete len:581 (-),score=156.37 TRINITY_DN9905_c1_g4_i1:210-1877(-)